MPGAFFRRVSPRSISGCPYARAFLLPGSRPQRLTCLTILAWGVLWYSRQKIGNAMIRVVYKLEHEGSDAGVFVRIADRLADPWVAVNRGYEVQINDEDDEYHTSGVLYSLTKAKSRPGQPGAWNTLEIALEGPRTVVYLNSELVTDYTEGDPTPPKRSWYEPVRSRRPDYGNIGLQNNSDHDVVF